MLQRTCYSNLLAFLNLKTTTNHNMFRLAVKTDKTRLKFRLECKTDKN